ncbi:hypothetical protein AVEN_183469-1 [Araneus ventricosus]|uniref:Uncharacterized protein n=1 Tax=Araneus ventricosus TaxID=182803 RepID=A0A4Y2TRR0_ARAVE|nr:hypothetical protein AVEN_183469-1 [Araneus ventricosus]
MQRHGAAFARYGQNSHLLHGRGDPQPATRLVRHSAACVHTASAVITMIRRVVARFAMPFRPVHHDNARFVSPHDIRNVPHGSRLPKRLKRPA